MVTASEIMLYMLTKKQIVYTSDTVDVVLNGVPEDKKPIVGYNDLRGANFSGMSGVTIVGGVFNGKTEKKSEQPTGFSWLIVKYTPKKERIVTEPTTDLVQLLADLEKVLGE